MKILFATYHGYPPQFVGGSESSTHDLCLTLQELGIQVGVLCRLSPKRPRGALHRLRRSAGFVEDETMEYPVFRAPNPAVATGEIVRRLRPTVAVIQAGRPLLLAERLTALGVPCVVYLRDAFFRSLGGEVGERANVRYVATSRDLAERFARTFGIVPASIPPVVRSERYRVQPSGLSVLFVCPVRKKGVGIALGLAARRPDIPFVFQESWWLNPVGRFVLKSRIRSMQNVTLRAWTLDGRGMYREARLVLVPSRCPEGWGRVVSEAQVSGIPALASTWGGLPESVGDGGILVDPTASLDQWERALARIWDDPVEHGRLAELARRHARRPDFQPPLLVARLLEVLDELIAANQIRV
jgi:glycosyltransferase involved in cell wall biosynthesis